MESTERHPSPVVALPVHRPYIAGPMLRASLFSLLILSTPLAAQGPGTVANQLKISATIGGGSLTLSSGDQFGRGSTAIGDVDGDGVVDLAVGAHSDDDGGTLGASSNVGAVWVLFLNSNGTVKGFNKLSATSGGFSGDLEDLDNFGRSVTRIGDLDLDGIPDIAVGANRDDDGGNNHGAIYIIFLNADGSEKSQQKISDTAGSFAGVLQDHDEFGRAIESLGDLDGDGVSDIAVGTPLDDDGGADKGAFWVLFMERDGTVKAHQKVSQLSGVVGLPIGSQDSFGMSLANLGDLDGDGVIDVAVGTPKDDDGGPRKGTVWILFMNSDGTAHAFQKISESTGGFGGALYDSEEFGTSVAGLGDMDGDGIGDLAVGAILDDDNFNDAGAIWILFLNSDGTVKGHQKINSSNGGFSVSLGPADWFGSSVSGMGDINGDGVPDLLGGARFDDDGGNDKGAVYLMLLNGVADVPLTADFSALASVGEAPLAVAFTDLSAGPARRWLWDFGDGSVSSASAPAHTYAVAGTYTVSLTVGEVALSDTVTKVGFVVVSKPAPVASFQGSPTSGLEPLTVVFTDSSSGAIDTYAWDFGDGSVSTLANPTATYIQAGTYSVSLTVTGAGGSDTLTSTDMVLVLPAVPDVGFSASTLTGEVPLTVTFANDTTGSVDSWSWSFGDGGTSTLSAPSNTYNTAGTYTVTLSATGPGGSDTEVQVDLIMAQAPPAPTADFVGSPSAGDAPLVVSFSDSSTGIVDEWSWDFGDGAGSSSANPGHTFGVPGSYSVSLTAIGPGGEHTTTKMNYIVAGTPPAPVADLDATPTSGAAPLLVSFLDQSSGQVASWDWDFGDGTSSTEQNPVHNYETLGSFTVSLSVTGFGGSDSVSLPIPLQVVAAGPDDPSFEAQTTGTQPANPWTSFGGAAHMVQPNTATFSDGNFPTEGLHWADLSSQGTDNATPPSSPGGVTFPAIGGAGVEQSFQMSPQRGGLRFDAAFLRAGAANDAAANDWMSVDVDDGLTTINLFYGDAFTAAPQTSLVYGFAMTDISTVTVDLFEIFPAANATTVFRLSAQVGNGGDGLDSSHGYLDNVVVGVPAGVTVRNGLGINPLCFSALNAPTIGEIWTTQVDTGGHPSAGLTLVLGYDQPLAGISIPFGELLVANEPFGGFLAFSSVVASGGGVAIHSMQAPSDPSLGGLEFFSQAVILGGAGPELCNALDIVLGL